MPRAVADEWLAVCDAIDRDSQRPIAEPLRFALAQQRLQTALLLLRTAWDEAEPFPLSAQPLVAEFRKLLEARFAQRWTVLDYARKLGYAERTLSRACRAHGGQTAKAMIDARVLLEAKRLLAHGNHSVEAISANLGFSEPSPFVQFFKRLEGVTPSVFRAAVRQAIASPIRPRRPRA